MSFSPLPPVAPIDVVAVPGSGLSVTKRGLQTLIGWLPGFGPGSGGQPGTELPAGGGAGQVLKVLSAAPRVLGWAEDKVGGGTGGPVVYGTTAGTATEGNDARVTGAMQKAASGSDIADKAAFRSALQLGAAALLAVGTASGTVAAGNDSRFPTQPLGAAAYLAVGTGAGTVAAGNDSRIVSAFRLTNGNISLGAAPTQNLDFGAADWAGIPTGIVQGTASAPVTNEGYRRPTVYVERHAAGRLNQRQATDSNWLLAPTVHVQTYIEAGGSNANTGVHSRVVSATAAGSAPAVDASDGQSYQLGIDLSVNCLCAYTGTVVLAAPNGTANRSAWAGNFEVYWNSGNKPTNLVGIEVDVINTAGAPSGQLPGVNDNWTGFWAQTASRNAYPSTCAYLATDANLTNGPWQTGWMYGVALLSNFYQWALYIDNRRNVQDANGTSQGAYINISYQASSANALYVAAGGNGQLQVTGDNTNPIAMRVNGVMRQVRVKAGNTLTASDIVLVHV